MTKNVTFWFWLRMCPFFALIQFVCAYIWFYVHANVIEMLIDSPFPSSFVSISCVRASGYNSRLMWCYLWADRIEGEGRQQMLFLLWSNINMTLWLYDSLKFLTEFQTNYLHYDYYCYYTMAMVVAVVVVALVSNLFELLLVLFFFFCFHSSFIPLLDRNLWVTATDRCMCYVQIHTHTTMALHVCVRMRVFVYVWAYIIHIYNKCSSECSPDS